MDNDEIREQDRIRERVNAALDSGEAEVLEWHPDRPTAHIGCEETSKEEK